MSSLRYSIAFSLLFLSVSILYRTVIGYSSVCRYSIVLSLLFLCVSILYRILIAIPLCVDTLSLSILYRILIAIPLCVDVCRVDMHRCYDTLSHSHCYSSVCRYSTAFSLLFLCVSILYRILIGYSSVFRYSIAFSLLFLCV